MNWNLFWNGYLEFFRIYYFKICWAFYFLCCIGYIFNPSIHNTINICLWASLSTMGLLKYDYGVEYDSGKN